MFTNFASLLARSKLPLVVGVVNVTPDSFSDGGAFISSDDAIEQAELMTKAGASIIEVGGESTAPSSRIVPSDEEWRRIETPIRTLVKSSCLAVDTYKASVAAKALEAGASIINDVSALRADPDLVRVIAEHGAGVILMHAKDAPLPHVTDTPRDYTDVVREIADFCMARVEVALRAGVRHEKIAIDPGIGRFVSHNPEYSWRLLREFERFVELVSPLPVMIGVSRKGFLGGALSERDPVSQFVALHAVANGASLVRTHNVEMTVWFIEVWNRLKRIPLT